MFDTEKFKSLVAKTQESSQAAAAESSPFVTAAKKAGASARSALTSVKSKLSFSDPDLTSSQNSQQGRPSRNKNILLDDPEWKKASTSSDKTTVAVNWLVRFIGPIIDQINNLGDVIKNFADRLDLVEKKTDKAPSDSEKTISDLQSELDEVRQRGMKGNLIVTSKERNGRDGQKIASLAKKNNPSETDVSMVLRLIEVKTGVAVPVEDVQACHVLGRRDSGSYIVRFQNRRPGSAWDNITTQMMTGRDMSVSNVFLNFQLTKVRTDLSFKVRTAKRNHKIFSYSIDQNGKISIKKQKDGEKFIIKNIDDLKFLDN